MSSTIVTETCPTTGCRWHQAAAIASWFAQVVVALILLQTLYFKFTYAPETRAIFEPLGGRPVATLVGFVELACIVLLLIPRTAAIGAVLSLAVIGGAIQTHLTTLGIVVRNPDTGEGDGGLLFGLALAVAAGSLLVLAVRWRQLPFVDRLRATFGLGVVGKSVPPEEAPAARSQV